MHLPAHSQYEHTRETSTDRGMKWLYKLIGVAVILIVSLFGDVMYIQLMQEKFSHDPLLLTICYIGGFTSFLVMGFMLAGKFWGFTPGRQMVVAWFVFGAEIIMVALNFMLIYQGTQNVTGLLASWLQFAPATPVFNMVGVALLLFLDESLLRKHRTLELEQEQYELQQRTHHDLALAAIDTKRHMVQYVRNSLAGAVNTESIQRIIDATAQDMVTGIASELSGRSHALPMSMREQDVHLYSGVKEEPYTTYPGEREQPPFLEQEAQESLHA